MSKVFWTSDSGDTQELGYITIHESLANAHTDVPPFTGQQGLKPGVGVTGTDASLHDQHFFLETGLAAPSFLDGYAPHDGSSTVNQVYYFFDARTRQFLSPLSSGFLITHKVHEYYAFNGVSTLLSLDCDYTGGEGGLAGTGTDQPFSFTSDAGSGTATATSITVPLYRIDGSPLYP